MTEKNKPRLPVVGWREWVAFPELGIGRIKAKIDSGARTSTLHVEDADFYRDAGRERVRFRVYPVQHRQTPVVEADAEIFERRQMKSSSGHVSERPVIRTLLRIADHTYEVELSLGSRDTMGFRLLIGRTGIRNRFHIDPARSYLMGEPAAEP